MDQDLRKNIEKEYRWEYRRRAMGIKPFNLKKAIKVAPAIAIGLSTWAIPVVLAATSAPAWIIPCALIAGKLISLTYGSVIIRKEFKEAKEQLNKDIDSGLLLERYRQDAPEDPSIYYTPCSVPERGTGRAPFNTSAELKSDKPAQKPPQPPIAPPLAPPSA